MYLCMCNITDYMYLQSGSSCTGFPSMLNVFSRLPPLSSPGIRLSVSKWGIFHYLVHLVILQRTEKKWVAACSQVLFLHSTNHNIHLWRNRCRCCRHLQMPAIWLVECYTCGMHFRKCTARAKRAKWLFILSLNMPANFLVDVFLSSINLHS